MNDRLDHFKNGSVIPAAPGYYLIFSYGNGEGFWRSAVIAWRIHYGQTIDKKSTFNDIEAICDDEYNGAAHEQEVGLLKPDGSVDTPSAHYASFELFSHEILEDEKSK